MPSFDVTIDIVSVLDEERVLPLADFCALSGLAQSLVDELVHEGILDPHGTPRSQWRFSTACLARAQRARRLHRELEMNWAAIAVVLPLLDELAEVRRQRARWQAWQAGDTG